MASQGFVPHLPGTKLGMSFPKRQLESIIPKRIPNPLFSLLQAEWSLEPQQVLEGEDQLS